MTSELTPLLSHQGVDRGHIIKTMASRELVLHVYKVAAKAFENLSHSADVQVLEKINTEVISQSITDINNDKKTQTPFISSTTVLLTVITIGLLSLIIGIGGFSPASIGGIVDMPIYASSALCSIGGLTLLSLIGLLGISNVEQLSKLFKNRIFSLISLVLIIPSLFYLIIGLEGLSGGIVGMPVFVSSIFCSLGGLLLLPLIGLIGTYGISKVTKKYPDLSEKCQTIRDKLLKKRSEWLLDSNLNDFSGGFAALFKGLALGGTAFAILMGCLNFPFGTLLLTSGIYSLHQSGISFRNAKKTGDKTEMIKQIINLIYGVAVFSLGLCVIPGGFDSLPGIICNFAIGFSAIAVAAFGIYKLIKTFKAVIKLNPNDTESFQKFLDGIFQISEDEAKEIACNVHKKYINDDNKILQWLDEKCLADLENYEKFIEGKTADKKRILKEKQEIKKELIQLIIKEEIQKALDQKLDDFRSLVGNETYAETLEYIFAEKTKAPKAPLLRMHNIELFKTIKKQIICKIVVELSKFILVFPALAFIPLFQMIGLISLTTFNYLMAGAIFSLLAVDIIPRFRNVPPALEKGNLDINEKTKEGFLNLFLDRIYKKKSKNQEELDAWKQAASDEAVD